MLLFLACVTKLASYPIHPLLVILSTLMDPIVTLKVPDCLSLAQSPFLSLLPKHLCAGYFILGIPQRNSTLVSSKPAPLSHIPYSVMNTINHLGAQARNLDIVFSPLPTLSPSKLSWSFANLTS